MGLDAPAGKQRPEKHRKNAWTRDHASSAISPASQASACNSGIAAATLERDPYSKLHLPRSSVRIRAGTGQNPVQPRSTEGG